METILNMMIADLIILYALIIFNRQPLPEPPKDE